MGGTALRRIGEDIRVARVGLGLSLANVAAAADISLAEVSRIERGDAPKVPHIVIARLCGAVGLDLVLKAYPGGQSVRDAGHVALLSDFARLLHSSLRWDTEVPLPIAGDQRAWDGLIRGTGWRYAAEAETSPRDGQALVRRLQLKLRDGNVDGLILLVRDTRTTRAFLEVAEPELRAMFPMSTRTILGALRRGAPPPGNGIVVVPRSRPSADVRRVSGTHPETPPESHPLAQPESHPLAQPAAHPPAQPFTRP
jgi:transcriptional regulator with XRE-family HTH domain